MRRIGFLRTRDRGGHAPVGGPPEQKTGWVPSDLASIAVIGGSGLYSLFDPTTAKSHTVATPYGDVDLTRAQAELVEAEARYRASQQLKGHGG